MLASLIIVGDLTTATITRLASHGEASLDNGQATQTGTITHRRAAVNGPPMSPSPPPAVGADTQRQNMLPVERCRHDMSREKRPESPKMQRTTIAGTNIIIIQVNTLKLV